MLRTHAAAWLGPLEPVVHRSTMVFSRGFLSECKVTFTTEAQRKALIGHARWATVTAVEAELALIESPCMKSLKTVRRISTQDAVRLCQGDVRYPFERLWICVEAPLDAAPETLVDADLRHRMIEAMRGYDRRGKAFWRNFLARHNRQAGR